MIFQIHKVVTHVNADLGGKVKDAISLKSQESEWGMKKGNPGQKSCLILKMFLYNLCKCKAAKGNLNLTVAEWMA